MGEHESAAFPPRRKREKRSEVRARILSVAYGIFAERGYEGASLERVAEAAGFSKGAVYSNFASKDELFYELLEAKIDERAAAIREALAADGGPRGGTLVGGEAAGGSTRTARVAGAELAALGAADPDWQMLFVEFWLRCARNEALRAKFAEKRRVMRAGIAEVFREEAAASGLILSAEDALSLATIVLALSNGLGIEGLIDPGSARPELFGEALARIVAPGSA